MLKTDVDPKYCTEPNKKPGDTDCRPARFMHLGKPCMCFGDECLDPNPRRKKEGK